MELRRAIRRKSEVLAECPKDGGVCQWWQHGQQRMVLSCGFCLGTHEDERGLMVRCKYKETYS